MIVECTQCQTRLKMDPTKVPPTGARVRCVKCQNIFKVFPPQSEASAPSEDGMQLDRSFTQEFEQASTSGPSESNASQDVATPPPPPPPVSEPKIPLSPKPKPKPSMPQTSRATPSAAPVRQILTEVVTPKQAWQRRGIFTLLALLGLALGFLVLGVRPTGTSFWLLFRYGLTKLPSAIEVVAYRGKVNSLPTGVRQMTVDGDLYNPFVDSKSDVELRLEAFSLSGEFLARKIEKANVRGLAPKTTTPFSMTMDLPTGSVGRFKVTVEKP